MSSELKWMILKNHEVLGPFTTSEIITNIYEGKYSPNDKVSAKVNHQTNPSIDESSYGQHFLNWRNLNEVSEFAIFKGATEDTLVNEAQEECTDPGDGFTEPSFDNDIKITDVDYEGGTRRGSRDRYYKVAPKKSKLVINTILIVVAVIMLSLAAYNRMTKISNEGADWSQIGVEQEKIGDYENAVGSFKKAHNNDPSDIGVAFNYAKVLIELGQLNKALDILNKISDPDIEQRKLNFLGIINLKRKNLYEAKSLFNKALDIDPSYIPALINSGIANLQSFQYANSHSKFELAYRAGSRNPVLIMSKFLTAVKLFEQNKNTTPLQYMKKVLASALTVQTGYKVHYNLALSYLEVLLGNTVVAGQWFKNIMILDADLEPSDFSYDLDIFRDHLNWDTMYELSMNFYDSLTKEPRLEAVKGILQLKSKKYDEAETSLSNAILRSSEDMAIRLLYAYLKINLGILSEAKANIELASNTNHSMLVLLKSKLCNQSQENCVIYFEEMSQTDHYRLQGITGLANHFINTKQYTKANSWVNEGLKTANSYIPIIILNQKLKSITKSTSSDK